MKKINNKKAFSLVELTMVIVIMALLFSVFAVSQKVSEQGRLVNAINVTAQQPNIIESNQLSLWLETSMPSRGKEKSYKLKDWDDLSKNKVLFLPSNINNKTTFEEKRIFPGIRSVHFSGTNSMQSEKALNLSSYTIFVVARPENGNTGNIVDSGFKITAQQIGDNIVTVFKNDGYNKYVKKELEGSFTKITNNDTLSSRPETIYIGNNGFKGEIFEVIIFDGVLDDDSIYQIETYLHRKYIN